MSFDYVCRVIRAFLGMQVRRLLGRPLLTCEPQRKLGGYRRNWPIILEEVREDEVHRLWDIGLSIDSKWLEGIRDKFPHFFHPDDYELTDWDIKIPLSVLMEAAKLRSKELYRGDKTTNSADRHFRLSGAFEARPELTLPIVAEWNGNVPDKVARQLARKLARAGQLRVKWEGKSCMVLDIVWRYETPRIGTLIETTPVLQSLSLVEDRFVALRR